LPSVLHKVICELVEAVDQRGPGVIFGYQDDDLSDFFDINIVAGKSEISWQPYSLAATIDEYFCGLHDTPPTFFDIYRNIYQKGHVVKNKINTVDFPLPLGPSKAVKGSARSFSTRRYSTRAGFLSDFFQSKRVALSLLTPFVPGSHERFFVQW
jgi:hypothetical protein